MHFADTMSGGQYRNNWRMAALPQGSARPVRELEAGARGVRPHADGRISTRQLGGTAIRDSPSRRRTASS